MCLQRASGGYGIESVGGGKMGGARASMGSRGGVHRCVCTAACCVGR
jgi:hypothetical protein